MKPAQLSDLSMKSSSSSWKKKKKIHIAHSCSNHTWSIAQNLLYFITPLCLLQINPFSDSFFYYYLYVLLKVSFASTLNYELSWMGCVKPNFSVLIL